MVGPDDVNDGDIDDIQMKEVVEPDDVDDGGIDINDIQMVEVRKGDHSDYYESRSSQEK